VCVHPRVGASGADEVDMMTAEFGDRTRQLTGDCALTGLASESVKSGPVVGQDHPDAYGVIGRRRALDHRRAGLFRP